MRTKDFTYDVIVIGAGHAGVEAALAAARIGCTTLILTNNIDTIGKMSCNPSIGGIGKGHIVREIDALGGEMGRLADIAGLNFRQLNTKNGPSVQATRAQCDKKVYQSCVKASLEKQDRLTIRQGDVEEICCVDFEVKGIITKTGNTYFCKCLIVTTGTFLRGLIHVGQSNFESGRAGDHSAIGLSKSLRSMGVTMGRLKTGTPPRLRGSTIDFTIAQVQHGDIFPTFFSADTTRMFHVEQIPCHITRTTRRTAEIIRDNISKSPLYSGRIAGIGPRYCPSIEDKIIKFSTKETHQLFLEPEGSDTEEYYLGGLSTSLPEEVQIDLIHTVIGLEAAEVVRFGYAVEYDYSPAYQLHSTLESKKICGLFLAGQINGTSGYEEAAAQGLVAGINAAQKVMNRVPMVLPRINSYIGLMIDDLVTLEITEPYRMFTARAENRLYMRFDNADLRLTPIGKEIGLISNARWNKYISKRDLISCEIDRLKLKRNGTRNQFEILRRPEVSYHDLEFSLNNLSQDIINAIEIEAKYEGYIKRDSAMRGKLGILSKQTLPQWIDYKKIPSLRTEAVSKLSVIRPDTILQAEKINGVTSSDVAILAVWLKKHGSA